MTTITLRCPTPTKVAYPNPVRAWREYRRITTRKDRRRARARGYAGHDVQGQLRPNRCRAGHWHLGHTGDSS